MTPPAGKNHTAPKSLYSRHYCHIAAPAKAKMLRPTAKFSISIGSEAPTDPPRDRDKNAITFSPEAGMEGSGWRFQHAPVVEHHH
jgi:hypothetical protein